MDLMVHLHGNVKEITPQSPSVDASNAGIFKDRMREYLEPGSALVLNMNKLEFLDSSGLGALVWLLREVESRAGKVRLCGLQKPVQILLEVVRMHRVFDIYPDAEQAVKGWKNAA